MQDNLMYGKMHEELTYTYAHTRMRTYKHNAHIHTRTYIHTHSCIHDHNAEGLTWKGTWNSIHSDQFGVSNFLNCQLTKSKEM